MMKTLNAPVFNASHTHTPHTTTRYEKLETDYHIIYGFHIDNESHGLQGKKMKKDLNHAN